MATIFVAVGDAEFIGRTIPALPGTPERNVVTIRDNTEGWSQEFECKGETDMFEFLEDWNHAGDVDGHAYDRCLARGVPLEQLP